MIDDEWWIGHVINKSPANEFYPYSSFMCYEIGWNNGEQERMSPWDMEPIDPESEMHIDLYIFFYESLVLFKNKNYLKFKKFLSIQGEP